MVSPPSEHRGQDARTWTVQEVLRWTTGRFDRAGIPTARLDAEILLARALGCNRLDLYLEHDRPLDAKEREVYREMVRRRASGEPAAYLLGAKEFYGRSFKIDRRVLIPRPETEHLVDEALDAIRDTDASAGKSGPVLDLCAGSGCVGISIAAELSELSVVAVELSSDAAALARENSEQLGVGDRVRVLVGDLFEPVRSADLGPFSAIVANPPYISSGEMSDLMRDVREHEPRQALEAGPRGTEILERIMHEAPDFAVPGAPIVLEHGEGQGAALIDLATASGRYNKVRDVRDHADLDRVLVAHVTK